MRSEPPNQEKGRNPEPKSPQTDDRAPISDEEIKLSEVVTQTAVVPPPVATRPAPVREVHWLLRLCSCFHSTNRRPKRRGKRTANHFLLPLQIEAHLGRATLVLDLDETLVHSTFQSSRTSDYVIAVEIEEQTHMVGVSERPGLHEFLHKVAELYEVVIFTASMSVYADKVIDVMDTQNEISFRLFRESCSFMDGVYVKDLELLGRNLSRVVIIDPENALPVESWFDDKSDNELFELLPLLESLAFEPNVTVILPDLNQRRKDLAEEMEAAKYTRNGESLTVANKVPPSVTTHTHDHGIYNSPKAGDKPTVAWSELVIGS